MSDEQREAGVDTEELLRTALLSRRGFARRALLASVGGVALGELLAPQPAAAATTPTWSTTGNTGSSPASNFIGTKDAQPLVVRTANVERMRVTTSGTVGVGVATPAAKVHSRSTTSAAGLFEHVATTGATPALTATTASTDANASAVTGSATAKTSGSFAAGVQGKNAGTGSGGYGVVGTHAGRGSGVYGLATGGGTGVYGLGTGDGHGVVGAKYGGTGAGGQFTGSSLGVEATVTSSSGAAIRATNTAVGEFKGVAVQGYAAGGTDAYVHPSEMFWQAGGEFCGLNGVIGAAAPGVSDGYGVIGLADNAIGVGVYARGTGGATALVAAGDAEVRGTLTKFGGSFRIDHPLDPANQYLSHSFVESPDMKNIYDGIATADQAGRASIQMPAWFDALNTDFRYQLSPIGAPAPELHVAEEVADGRFAIAGARPHQRVSWQVTGIRQDAWANANRIVVEQGKPAHEQGRFLSPALHGAPAGAQIGAQTR